MQVLKMQGFVADCVRCYHQHLAILATEAAILPRDSRCVSVMMAPMNFV